MRLITFFVQLIARMSLSLANSLPLIAYSLRSDVRNELKSQVYKKYILIKRIITYYIITPPPTRTRAYEAFARVRACVMVMSSNGSYLPKWQVRSRGTVALLDTVCFMRRFFQKRLRWPVFADVPELGPTAAPSRNFAFVAQCGRHSGRTFSKLNHIPEIHYERLQH